MQVPVWVFAMEKNLLQQHINIDLESSKWIDIIRPIRIKHLTALWYEI